MATPHLRRQLVFREERRGRLDRPETLVRIGSVLERILQILIRR